MRPPDRAGPHPAPPAICGAILSTDELRLLLALRTLDARTRQSVIDIAITAAGLGRHHDETPRAWPPRRP